MATTRMRPAVKKLFVLVLVICIGIYGYNAGWYNKVKNLVAPKKEVVVKTTPEANKAVEAGTPIVRCGINTWGGNAPGPYFNGGFGGSTKSRYFKEFGIIVEFYLFEKQTDMRNAWRAGKIDIMGLMTVDSIPAEIDGIKGLGPRAFIKIDDSFGGDEVVALDSIKRAKDLEGEEVALLPNSPSHTVLLVWCEADGADPKKIRIVPAEDGFQAGEIYRSKNVKAAIVWAPEGKNCKDNRGGHIVFNTKKARKAVGDVLAASEKYIRENRDVVTKFSTGWLIGAAEINSSADARQRAAEIISGPMNVKVEEALEMLDNAKLSTLGDNQQFFGLRPGGVTGQEVYSKMTRLYRNAGVIQANVPPWREISDPSIISSIKLTGKIHEPEEAPKFAPPTKAEAQAPAFATKTASIKFAFNSGELDREAKSAIREYFGDQVKEFSGARFRVEGNTDNVGGADYNDKLSFARARAVVSHMVNEFKLDENQFVVQGNGFRNPVPGCEKNQTEECRSRNRRTELGILY